MGISSTNVDGLSPVGVAWSVAMLSTLLVVGLAYYLLSFVCVRGLRFAQQEQLSTSFKRKQAFQSRASAELSGITSCPEFHVPGDVMAA